MKSPSQIRLMTGIRSHRPNPIVINRKDPANIKATQPDVMTDVFEAVEFDKDHSFHNVQARWFHKKLTLGEQLSLTAEQLKMICDESHEMGRMRERKLKVCNCPVEY